MKIRKALKVFIFTIVTAAVIAGFAAMMVNNHVVQAAKECIQYSFDGIDEDNDHEPDGYAGSSTENTEIPEDVLSRLRDMNADCILVLGAGITDSETPSPMLKDRLDAGIKLYEEGLAPKILLSGDNGSQGHNEIHVMLSYTLEAGVPAEDIFCDHAGFSTYESMERARDIFGVKSAIVVSQTYHEYRALYIGEKLGLDLAGVAADQEKYAGQAYRELREVAARNKDFLMMLFDMGSAVGGEEIPITGSGEISHGE